MNKFKDGGEKMKYRKFQKEIDAGHGIWEIVFKGNKCVMNQFKSKTIGSYTNNPPKLSLDDIDDSWKEIEITESEENWLDDLDNLVLDCD